MHFIEMQILILYEKYHVDNSHLFCGIYITYIYPLLLLNINGFFKIMLSFRIPYLRIYFINVLSSATVHLFFRLFTCAFIVYSGFSCLLPADPIFLPLSIYLHRFRGAKLTYSFEQPYKS